MTEKSRARGALIISMLIFGTIGVLRRSIPLPSGALAMLRGYIGAGILMAVTAARRRLFRGGGFRQNMAKLLLSGALIGGNWILLFEAYEYTSVAVATLCYYMAPVFVMLFSPLLGERLTRKRLICVAVAVAGMTLVSGVFSVDGFGAGDMKGVLAGLGAALMYACVVMTNKRISGVEDNDRTTVQLIAAAVVVTPYVLLAEHVDLAGLGTQGILLTLVAGAVHTAFAYALYFGAMAKLPARTVAVMSYIDPVSAVVLSAVLLGEPMGIAGVIGAVMVIGALIFGELTDKG